MSFKFKMLKKAKKQLQKENKPQEKELSELAILTLSVKQVVTRFCTHSMNYLPGFIGSI